MPNDRKQLADEMREATLTAVNASAEHVAEADLLQLATPGWHIAQPNWAALGFAGSWDAEGRN